MMEGMRAFMRAPGGWRITLGGAIVALLLLAAFAGPGLTAYDADEMDLENVLKPPSIGWLQSLTVTEQGRKSLRERGSGSVPAPGPDPGSAFEEEFGFLRLDEEAGPAVPDGEASPNGSHAHVLGTDKNGRDMLALLVAGARNAVLPGLVACLAALVLGIPFGLLSGYYGGRLRAALQGAGGVLLSMPRLVLILVVICALEPNVYYIMGVLGLTLVPRVSDHMASRVSLQARSGFVVAAKEGGLPDSSILLRHLFWYQNRAVLFIQFSLIMAESILVETTLSYLQFGTKPPEVSWGNIIEGSRLTFFSGLYWITFFPAAAIVIAILGFFYLGDGLSARLAYREGK